jgi:hypothetical protein
MHRLALGATRISLTTISLPRRRKTIVRSKIGREAATDTQAIGKRFLFRKALPNHIKFFESRT